ncbi:MAG: NUDIX hydrolase [Gammaproteobacteria bacterium]|nr:NUDIX hydrolase [Gammaproteobacteria bacterium]
MHRQKVLELLDNYKTPYMEEAAMVQRARRFAEQHPNCFERIEEGHFTGSAWVLNPAHSHTLMLHHRKLDLWLQPGGHADGDPDITRVVLNEVAEEAGVNLDHIKLVDDNIFDVDIHVIHANEHDPRHQHFDIRFLVEIDDSLDLPGNEESHQIGWVALANVPQFNHARSFYRMVQKTRRILA